MISAHIFGTRATSPHALVWECLSSLSGFCDTVVVHDHGMPQSLYNLVDEFSRIKRMIVVDTTCPSPISELADDEWIYLGVLDEIVHEDSHHYLWDLALKHNEFFAADVPLWTVCGAFGITESLQTRLARRDVLDQFHFDGDVFSVDLAVEFRSPSGHMPKPIWKFTQTFSSDLGMSDCEGKMGLFTNIEELPRCVRRLVGRHTYQPPYMERSKNG